MTLENFFTERLFVPLGMVDSGFQVKEENQGRFSALYEPLVGPSMGSLNAPDPGERHGLKLMELTTKAGTSNLLVCFLVVTAWCRPCTIIHVSVRC